MIKKILCSVDGSEYSKNALHYAMELSDKWNAGLIVLSVIPNLNKLIVTLNDVSQTYYYDFDDFEDLKKYHQRTLLEAVNSVSKEHPKIEIRSRLAEGRPGDTIVKIAEEEDVDLIVMGNKGRGRITGLILGGTSRRVAETCARPILIVK